MRAAPESRTVAPTICNIGDDDSFFQQGTDLVDTVFQIIRPSNMGQAQSSRLVQTSVFTARF